MRTPKPMYSSDFWWTYAKHPDFDVRWSIFSKFRIPIEILAYLANDIDWVIRVEVASYSRTPLEILKQLILDGVYGVQASVWQNPNCNEEIRLLYLANKKYGHLTNRHTQSLSDSDFAV